MVSTHGSPAGPCGFGADLGTTGGALQGCNMMQQAFVNVLISLVILKV